jgi:hypothetical protein
MVIKDRFVIKFKIETKHIHKTWGCNLHGTKAHQTVKLIACSQAPPENLKVFEDGNFERQIIYNFTPIFHFTFSPEIIFADGEMFVTLFCHWKSLTCRYSLSKLLTSARHFIGVTKQKPNTHQEKIVREIFVDGGRKRGTAVLV